MKKSIWLFIIGSAILIGLMLSTANFNYSSLATDSGFDTSYDSGGGDSDGGSIIYLIYMFIEYPIPTTIVVIILVILTIREKQKRRSYDNNLNYQTIETAHAGSQYKDLLKSAYYIFYETQMAWMNFNYNRLRELVSDELYNTYYNQLESLKLKGQRNVMEGFKVQHIRVISTKEENGVIEYCIELKVYLFDYLVDSTGATVRGSNSSYHAMTYQLTFASSVKKLELCPNCSAPLPENSICNYCHSHVQGLRELRLVKKINVKQQEVE